MDNEPSSYTRNKLVELITRFIASTAGVNSALISSNGYEIASKSISSVDMERISTVASTLSAVGNMAVEEFGCGDMYNSLVIQSDDGFLLIMNIIYEDNPITFCIITSKEVVIAKIIQLAKKIVKKIKRILSDVTQAIH